MDCGEIVLQIRFDNWILCHVFDQALTTASHSTENHTAILTSNPVTIPSSPPPRAIVTASMASIPRRLAAAASSLARSASGSQLSGAESKRGAGAAADAKEEKVLDTQSLDREKVDTGMEVMVALKQDLLALCCLATVVGVNNSWSGLFVGSHWTAIVVVLTLCLFIKTTYDVSKYLSQPKQHQQ